jgi:hypothetical protein
MRGGPKRLGKTFGGVLSFFRTRRSASPSVCGDNSPNKKPSNTSTSYTENGN